MGYYNVLFCRWLQIRVTVGKYISLVRHLQETAWTRYTRMWAERGISPLYFNIVPTDIDAFVRKVGVLGPYVCCKVFICGETASFECPLQSREGVEVARRQVGTLGNVVQAIPTEDDNMVGRSCYRVGSRIIQHTRAPVLELLAPSPHHLYRHGVRTICIRTTT
jgi:hypothetical protein